MCALICPVYRIERNKHTQQQLVYRSTVFLILAGVKAVGGAIYPHEIINTASKKQKQNVRYKGLVTLAVSRTACRYVEFLGVIINDRDNMKIAVIKRIC